MKKVLATLVILCFLGKASVISAQFRDNFFVSIGGGVEFLTAKRDVLRGINAAAQLILLSGGNPDITLKKRMNILNPQPRVQIGYRIDFDQFELSAVAGTSYDWSNSFRLAGTAAVGGRTYPYPKAFYLALRGQKKIKNGLVAGFEVAMDNQKSEVLLNHSNYSPQVIGLLNQISGDINVTNSNLQALGLFGYEASKDQFSFFSHLKVGYIGGFFGGTAEIGLKMFPFKKREKKWYE